MLSPICAAGSRVGAGISALEVPRNGAGTDIESL